MDISNLDGKIEAVLDERPEFSSKNIEDSLNKTSEVAKAKKSISKRTVLKFLKRLRGFFPLTWAGALFICLVYAVWYGEVVRHQNQILFASVLWLISAFVLVFVFELIGIAVVWAVTASMNKNLPGFNKLETKQVLDSGFRVFRPFWLPFIQVSVQNEDTPFTSEFRKDGQWLRELITINARGRYESANHLVTVGDIFGVLSFTFPHSMAFDVEIKPSSCQFESVQFSARTSGEGYSFPTGENKGELVEMRRYQAGDPLRYLLWRVFARSRKLLVRSPEPAIVEEHEMFVYFVAGTEDESSASLTRTFLSTLEGTETELHFCADGTQRVSTDPVEAMDDIIESVRHRGQGGMGMLEQASKVPSGALRRFFIMVPSTKGVWVENVKNFCISSGHRPIFVMALEPTEINAKKSSMMKRMFCVVEKEQNKQAEREKLCNELCDFGTVQLVDIKTGESMIYEASKASRKASAKSLPAGGSL